MPTETVRCCCAHASGNIKTQKPNKSTRNTFRTRASTTSSFAFSGPGLATSWHQHSSCQTVASQGPQPITKLLGCWITRSELPAFPGCTYTGIEQSELQRSNPKKNGKFSVDIGTHCRSFLHFGKKTA